MIAISCIPVYASQRLEKERKILNYQDWKCNFSSPIVVPPYSCSAMSLCIFKHVKVYSLTLIRPRGGGSAFRPPQHFSKYLPNAQNFCRDATWLFSFKYRATFETKFAAPARTVFVPRPFEKNSSTPKLLKNVILCTKSMQIVFSLKYHINLNILSFNGSN